MVHMDDRATESKELVRDVLGSDTPRGGQPERARQRDRRPFHTSALHPASLRLISAPLSRRRQALSNALRRAQARRVAQFHTRGSR